MSVSFVANDLTNDLCTNIFSGDLAKQKLAAKPVTIVELVRDLYTDIVTKIMG